MGASISGVGSLVTTLDTIDERWTSDVTYVVSANQNYAIHVEYGTSKMAAQPYLRPAAERTNRRLDQIGAETDSVEEFVRLAAQEVERIAKEIVPVDTGALRASIKYERVS
ncbi:HK97 gp10 family phage protein [Halomarina litorea]|uniref:HK97 gp10 family phage protein n=1 Tax=Halomarina litorea TaxID=2961595 RepID=UPI0020C3C0BB|nr:HK97 gp10 family phage protein [Halomarina sp. BCD28]